MIKREWKAINTDELNGWVDIGVYVLPEAADA